MAATAAPEPPEEDWDEEPMLPTGLLDRGRTVDWAAATEGDETREDEPLMQAGDGEAPTHVKPEADPEGQTGVLEEPTHREPDTTCGEAVEVPALDEPPVVEAAGGVIETDMVEALERPEGTTLGIEDEGAEATPALRPALLPHLEATDEFQDMPELEDAEPENDT